MYKCIVRCDTRTDSKVKSVCTYMRICLYVNMDVPRCMDIYIYIYIYTHTHTHTHLYVRIYVGVKFLLYICIILLVNKCIKRHTLRCTHSPSFQHTHTHTHTHKTHTSLSMCLNMCTNGKYGLNILLSSHQGCIYACVYTCIHTYIQDPSAVVKSACILQCAVVFYAQNVFPLYT